MKVPKIAQAMNHIDDDLIAGADGTPQKKKSGWIKWASAAACLCLALAGIYGIVGKPAELFPFPGGNAGGGGGDGVTYMSYAGPVFPLTALENADGIIVRRNVDYDFSPYKSVTYHYEDKDGVHSYEGYDTEAVVTDRYTLTNDTDEAKSLTMLYPFAGSLRDELSVIPELSADGKVLATQLQIGSYSGSFAGAWGGGGESLNLSQINSWEQYRALLSDGRYLQAALADAPVPNQPVVVYELSDRTASAEAMKETPDIVLEMTVDYSKTTVLSYGFNYGSTDIETGYLARGTHVPQSGSVDYGDSVYLIIVGEEPESFTMTGYRSRSTNKKDESVTASVTRYETTLGEILHTVNQSYLSQFFRAGGESSAVMQTLSDAQLLGVVSKHLTAHGVQAERYDNGMLENLIGDAYAVKRVMYLRFTLTVPAGGSVELSARMTKDASIDFVGKNRDRNGYDLVTQLGSNLLFAEQSASVSNTEDIEIIDQNFGFDLENGVTVVTLDKNQEHYRMDVRKRKA